MSITGCTTQVVNVDLFDVDESKIKKLKDEGNLVSCYFSAGTSENWRDDYNENKAAWKNVEGNAMGTWAGESWLNIEYLHEGPNGGPGIADLMAPRLSLAKLKGCHAVEPDNVDCWQADQSGRWKLIHLGREYQKCYPGMPRWDPDDQSTWGAYEAQLQYLKWLSDEAHSRGLAIALKNDLEQVERESNLASDFDFHVVEECIAYNECDKTKRFLDKGKAVYVHEYRVSPTSWMPPMDEDGNFDDSVTYDSSKWKEYCTHANDKQIELQASSCLGNDCADMPEGGPVWSYCNEDDSTFTPH